MSGWIKLYRAINEWGWKKDPHVMALWIHLLSNSNFEDSFFLGVLIKKGSCATGLISLAEKTGLTISQVRTCLNKLKLTGEIAIKSGNKFSIISIVKWDEYQDDSTQDSKPIANQSQTDSKPIATSKESKNLRIKEDGIRVEGGNDFKNDNFEEFWLGWKPFDMDKGSKANAEKFYNQAIKEISHEDIIGKRDEYIKSCHGNQRRTTHASTWLNPKGRRGWADDYAAPKGESLFSPRAEDVRVANRVHATSREIDRLLGEN